MGFPWAILFRHGLIHTLDSHIFCSTIRLIIAILLGYVLYPASNLSNFMDDAITIILAL